MYPWEAYMDPPLLYWDTKKPMNFDCRNTKIVNHWGFYTKEKFSVIGVYLNKYFYYNTVLKRLINKLKAF